MEQSLVSVVITVFKRPERTKKAIATVKSQTYPNIEIIVVDGSNSKVIKKVVEEENCIYLPVEEEYVNAPFWTGIQHQRNVGCKYAHGKYIALLDDDDEWKKDKLEKQVRVFEGEGYVDNIGLVVSYTKNLDGENKFIDKPKTYPCLKDLLRSFNYSSTSSYMIRSDILLLVGRWDEKLRGMHEYDLALKVLKYGYMIVTVPEILTIRCRSFNQESKYYFIKIAEVLDLWHNYGKDMIDCLSFHDRFLNMIKTVGLLAIFTSGFVLKDKVWRIIYIQRMWAQQGEIQNEK